MKEYILCAAIHYNDNKEYYHQPINIKTGFVVTGHRHHNCFMTVKILREPIKGDHTQGFLTNTNKFVNRIEAMRIAISAGQGGNYSKMRLSEPLFSEDLY